MAYNDVPYISLIVSTRDIKVSEELFISYGTDYWS